jgi:hypothetical protein
MYTIRNSILHQIDLCFEESAFKRCPWFAKMPIYYYVLISWVIYHSTHLKICVTYRSAAIPTFISPQYLKITVPYDGIETQAWCATWNFNSKSLLNIHPKEWRCRDRNYQMNSKPPPNPRFPPIRPSLRPSFDRIEGVFSATPVISVSSVDSEKGRDANSARSAAAFPSSARTTAATLARAASHYDDCCFGWSFEVVVDCWFRRSFDM